MARQFWYLYINTVIDDGRLPQCRYKTSGKATDSDCYCSISHINAGENKNSPKQSTNRSINQNEWMNESINQFTNHTKQANKQTNNMSTLNSPTSFQGHHTDRNKQQKSTCTTLHNTAPINTNDSQARRESCKPYCSVGKDWMEIWLCSSATRTAKQGTFTKF